LLDKDEEQYEEEPTDNAEETGDAGTIPECPLCKEVVMPGALAHPVATSFGDQAILLFLHYRCYENSTPEQVEETVRGIRFDMILASCDEAEIGNC
jgi:hypothetical protein